MEIPEYDHRVNRKAYVSKSRQTYVVSAPIVALKHSNAPLTTLEKSKILIPGSLITGTWDGVIP